jgi:hypothetical protein
MVDVSVKIEGLENAMKAMLAAFPTNERRQRGILNASIRTAATDTILADAKQRAKSGDGSGALSEALGIRATSKKKLKSRRVVAGVEIVPVRSNMKAMAMYIQHYYTAKGKTAPAKMLTSGVRHGHLVEFGSLNNPARPFLWPAAESKRSAYIGRFAADLTKKTEAAVRREAKTR